MLLWSSCQSCWAVRLQSDPVLKIVWGAYLDKCRELERGQRRPTRELLQLSKGAITAEIAQRIVEFAQTHKKPLATVEDVIAAEEQVAQRRSQMHVVVPFKTSPDEDDGTNGEDGA